MRRVVTRLLLEAQQLAAADLEAEITRLQEQRLVRVLPESEAFELRLFRLNDDRAAAVAAWEAGRRKFGPVWHGPHPLICAYTELIDFQNYLAEATRWGDVESGEFELLHNMALLALRDLRCVVARLEARDPEALTRRPQAPGGSVDDAI